MNIHIVPCVYMNNWLLIIHLWNREVEWGMIHLPHLFFLSQLKNIIHVWNINKYYSTICSREKNLQMRRTYYQPTSLKEKKSLFFPQPFATKRIMVTYMAISSILLYPLLWMSSYAVVFFILVLKNMLLKQFLKILTQYTKHEQNGSTY